MLLNFLKQGLLAKAQVINIWKLYNHIGSKYKSSVRYSYQFMPNINIRISMTRPYYLSYLPQHNRTVKISLPIPDTTHGATGPRQSIRVTNV